MARASLTATWTNQAAITLATIVFVSFLLPIGSFGAQQANASEASRQEEQSNGTRSGPRLAVRVSLESKSFDLVEEERAAGDKLEADREVGLKPESPVHNNINSTDATPKPRAKKASKKSSRRLSNIWSMFLPGSSHSSSDSSDYETDESAADEEAKGSVIGGDGSSSSSSSAAAASSAASSGSGPNSTAKSAPEDETNERLVAKVAKPMTSSRQGELMFIGSSVAPTSENSPKASGQNVTTDDSPVRLITGALSKPPSEPAAAPNMNEIVSSIMSSLNLANSTESTGKKTERESEENSTDSGESEDLDHETQPPTAPAAGNRTAPASSDNREFERWLNRIKMQKVTTGGFRGPTATTSGSSSRNPTRDGAEPGKPSKATATGWHSRAASLPGAVEAGTKSAIKSTASLKWPQQSQNTDGVQWSRDSGVKGLPKRATQMQQQQQHIDHYKHQSHPFQQQMRQQQTQLIHGIKYPAGQASTISVSTTDGASNTSLSFGSHYIPQLNPINANQAVETSQVANSSSAQTGAGLANHQIGDAPASSSNGSSAGEQKANFEQANIYQSQDEILRQVTSAINFEQEQLQLSQQSSKGKKSANEKQNEFMNSSTNLMAPDGSNSSQSGSGPVSPLESRLKSMGNSTSGGSLDVDKSFDLLAERVQQLASQQQQLQDEQRNLLLLQTNSSTAGQQPSWLRPSLLQQAISEPNLNSLLASLNQNKQLEQTTASNKQKLPQQLNLEQVRELLQKHEQTKNELKSSQEKMMQLMRQMMQLKTAGLQRQQQEQKGNTSGAPLPSSWTTESNGPAPPAAANLINDDQQSLDRPLRLPAGATNVGWMPLNGQLGARQQQQQTPISPAHLMKGRVRFHQRQQQLPKEPQVDNVGLVLPPAVDEIDGVDLMDQRVIGLPIALLNNNEEVELSRAQLEEAARLAAEQLGALPPFHQTNQAPAHHFQREVGMNKMAPQALDEPLRQTSGSNKFVPRVAPNQMAQNRQQQAEQLNSVQKLLQNNSPQTFAPQNGRPPALSTGQFQNELQQYQQNLMQIEKLVSLLPPDQRNQLSDLKLGGVGQLADEQSQTNMSHQLELVANALSNRPEISLLASFNQNRLKKEESQSQSQASVNSKSEEKIRDDQQKQTNGDPNGVAPTNAQWQQDKRPQPQQQFVQQQHLQHQQQIGSNPMPSFPQVIGHYGQIPRPASESIMQDFRPLLGPQAYPPPGRGLNVAADNAPAALVTTSSVSAASGPPMRLREISLYRPFGFRSHHAVTYQAAPGVAAMFPRLIAQPPGLDQGGRLIQPPLSPGRPGILRHMTPIRATINEGQRLISQMLPHQLADHLSHYHRHHHHQYPAHTSMGSLPIPPMRQHHQLLSHPMRRQSQSPSRPSTGSGHDGDRMLAKMHEERGARSSASGSSLMLAPHTRPTRINMGQMGEAEYSVSDDGDNQLIQGDDELVFANPEQAIDSGASNGEQLEQLHLFQAPSVDEHQVGGSQLTSRSRPSRQMLSPAERKRAGHLMNPSLAQLAVDQPSTMQPITQPCIPMGLKRISQTTTMSPRTFTQVVDTSTTTTTSPTTTTASGRETTQTPSTATPLITTTRTSNSTST